MSLVKKKKTAKSGTSAATAKQYDVIVRPVITEKTSMMAEQNKIVFHVAKDATKKDVKQAVESIFSVTVAKVNTVNIDGKTKRFRGREGQRNDVRKAIVTLAEGQSIDFAAGAR